MSKFQKYEDVREVTSKKRSQKRKAIAKRQAERMAPKNGAEILFGLIWPGK